MHRLALATTGALWCGILLGRAAPMIAVHRWRVILILGLGTGWWAWRRIHRHTMLVLVGIALLTGVMAGAGAWWATPSVADGECSGRATVITEAETSGTGVRGVIGMSGVRLAVRAHGRPAWRLTRLRAGESVEVSGRCRPVAGSFATWQRSRHVLGEMTVQAVGENVGDAPPLARSVNRLHDTLRRGSRMLSPEDASLYRGLVVGADDGQPRSMVDAFRATGLGHLTAVSGQNVAYVMTLVMMVVSARGRGVRRGVTLAMLGWFALITRAEPSVVRAVSAGVATVVVAGARGPTVAAVSIAGALLVDPMLAHSVGFQLSCSAALGLTLATGPVTRILGDGRSARVIAPTITAQLATLPLSWAYFGMPSAVAIPANLLAAPVAGLVMFCGLPAGVVAGFLPDAVASTVMFPVAAMVRWVWWVAHVGSAVDLAPWVDAVCWMSVGAVVLLRRRRGAEVATPSP